MLITEFSATAVNSKFKLILKQMATGTAAAMCDVERHVDAIGSTQRQQDDCMAVVEAAAASAQQSKAVDKKAKQKAQVRPTPTALGL